MMLVKSSKGNPNHRMQTIGDKVLSVLRQPLFSFTFSLPDKKKPEPSAVVKSVERKKAIPKKQNISMPVKTQNKPLTVNTPQKRRVNTAIFTPLRNKEAFEKIQFALRACDRNNITGFTGVLHVERSNKGSRLVASDGKRLHVTELDRIWIRPGNYRPIVTKELINMGKPVSNVNFPNWERVVPAKTARKGCIYIENTAINENSSLYKTFEKLSGEKVNPNYLSDLKNKTWVIYCQNEKKKALVLKEFGAEKETYAVIMPLA